MHIMSNNFAKTQVWKHEYDIVTSQTTHTKYQCLPYATE